MKRISSKTTFYHKRIFPLAWFGGTAVAEVALLFSMGKPNGPPAGVLLVPLVMAAFGYFLLRILVLDLVDEVYDCVEFLLVKNRGVEQRVFLRDIRNISFSNMTNPARVTISLREDSPLGRNISFTPLTRFGGVFAWHHPLVEDLINRMDKARSR